MAPAEMRAATACRARGGGVCVCKRSGELPPSTPLHPPSSKAAHLGQGLDSSGPAAEAASTSA